MGEKRVGTGESEVRSETGPLRNFEGIVESLRRLFSSLQQKREESAITSAVLPQCVVPLPALARTMASLEKSGLADSSTGSASRSNSAACESGLRMTAPAATSPVPEKVFVRLVVTTSANRKGSTLTELATVSSRTSGIPLSS